MNLYEYLNARHSRKFTAHLKQQMEDYEAGKLKTYSWDDLELRRMERELAPWWEKTFNAIRYRLFGKYNGLFTYHLSPRHIVNQFVWAKQRMKRGWADSDCWNIDGYITKVLGEQLAYLAEHSHAYPGQPPWETPEQWEVHLRDLSTRILAWHHRDETEEARETTREALKEFAEKFDYYWD